MYQLAKRVWYNNHYWVSVIYSIYTGNLRLVKLAYSLLVEHRDDSSILFEAILRGYIDIIEYFLAEGIKAKKEDIEAYAIYSGKSIVVSHFINKGYTFDSNDIIELAKHYHDNEVYHHDQGGDYIKIYHIILTKYKIETLLEKEDNYLNWLSDRSRYVLST